MSRLANPKDPRWKWMCRFYYGDLAKAPRVPGELAIETVHETDSSKDMEVSVGEKREDIGKIEIVRLSTWRGWHGW